MKIISQIKVPNFLTQQRTKNKEGQRSLTFQRLNTSSLHSKMSVSWKNLGVRITKDMYRLKICHFRSHIGVQSCNSTAFIDIQNIVRDFNMQIVEVFRCGGSFLSPIKYFAEVLEQRRAQYFERAVRSLQKLGNNKHKI